MTRPGDTHGARCQGFMASLAELVHVCVGPGRSGVLLSGTRTAMTGLAFGLRSQRTVPVRFPRARQPCRSSIGRARFPVGDGELGAMARLASDNPHPVLWKWPGGPGRACPDCVAQSTGSRCRTDRGQRAGPAAMCPSPSCRPASPGQPRALRTPQATACFLIDALPSAASSSGNRTISWAAARTPVRSAIFPHAGPSSLSSSSTRQFHRAALCGGRPAA
jgi:hypothetical protein